MRFRNFRLFWLGQLVSVVGTSIQVVAEGWLIYDLTGSTFWLGMVGLLGLLPVVPVSIFGGLLIDRVPRRRLILLTQVLLMAQALLFGLLAWRGTIQLWQIIGLYFLFGAILAIDHPARRAFLVELVGKDELANAVALNATLFNMSSLIGYALAGLLIAAIGVGVTMMFNGLTYLAPIAALLLIRMADRPAESSAHKPGNRPADTPAIPSAAPPTAPPTTPPRLKVALLEGVVSLWKQPAVLGVMSLMAVVGGLSYPVFGMMPAFAESVMGVGARGLGLLMAAGALGSVIGTVIVARVGSRQRGRMLAAVAIALPVLMVGFAQSRALWLVCLLLVGIGAAILVLQSLAVTIVQIQTEDRVRGRVMTLYSQLHAGSDTLGNVGVGALAVYVGLPLALAAAGVGALLYAAVLWLRMPSVARYD
ncbi:MAG: MFS transporter [Litorilinea sp.]